ncbi:MAG TPA: Fic family protein [Hanamia sp.]
MKKNELKILSAGLLEEYCKSINDTYLKKYKELKESQLSIDTFSFYTSVSAVFSSKIEGENIELDSYVKHKRFGIKFLPDYTLKIDDLYNTYQLAKRNKCNRKNIELVHKMLTLHILSEKKLGKIRTGNMYITTEDGRIEYVATSPYTVKSEMEKFYNDLETLLKQKLSLQKVFYYASFLHLVFVKIHPYDDGNGRTARLIEKWFLAEKLGSQTWLIQSEKNYYLNHKTYYKNIRLLGMEYERLDYSKAMPFLRMLPQSLTLNEEKL